MRLFLSIIFISLSSPYLLAQSLIQGKVTDNEGEAIAGANVYLEHTYDGTSSDTLGQFSFVSEAIENQTLIISAISYETRRIEMIMGRTNPPMDIALKQSAGTMKGLTITAGAFEAGDANKSVVLSSLDIVTTAGALGDISGALQTLPGTQTVGEDGRLFIRGGDSHETQVYIDGMLAQSPFSGQVPNLPTRGRFSPFLFKGTTFSTGGYSAAYGQALSSALILETKDKPVQTQTDISLMTVGGDITHQHTWDEASLAFKAGYTNLLPYQALVPQEMDMFKPPQTAEIALVGRKKTSKTGLLKAFVQTSRSQLGLHQANMNIPGSTDSIALQNDNLYANLNFRELLNQRWSLQTGVSYTYDQQHSSLNEYAQRSDDHYLHSKAVFTNDLSEDIALRLGAELLSEHHTQQKAASENYQPEASLQQQISSIFIEGDIYLTQKLMVRPGVRASYAALNSQWILAPRYSMAYKTGKHSQVSMAYGQYYQQQNLRWLLQYKQLDLARADHYILNYQLNKENKIFRIEAYHKKYHKLVSYSLNIQGVPQQLNTRGRGYARGIDIFWRDRKSIPNGDYWVSYSLLDTERDFLHYPQAAMPSFASRHNFSVVYKHFISPIRTQLGGSYQWNSGRPYENPNHGEFLSDRTPAYHNLSLNAAFLCKEHIILYGSVSNVMGTPNIFGYEYASQPNAEGVYLRRAVEAPAPRFFFLGLFITLSENKKANQLDQL